MSAGKKKTGGKKRISRRGHATIRPAIISEETLDGRIYKWYIDALNNGCAVDNDALLKQAKKINFELTGTDNFFPKIQWLLKWKKRVQVTGNYRNGDEHMLLPLPEPDREDQDPLSSIIKVEDSDSSNDEPMNHPDSHIVDKAEDSNSSAASNALVIGEEFDDVVPPQIKKKKLNETKKRSKIFKKELQNITFKSFNSESVKSVLENKTCFDETNSGVFVIGGLPRLNNQNQNINITINPCNNRYSETIPKWEEDQFRTVAQNYSVPTAVEKQNSNNNISGNVHIWQLPPLVPLNPSSRNEPVIAQTQLSLVDEVTNKSPATSIKPTVCSSADTNNLYFTTPKQTHRNKLILSPAKSPALHSEINTLAAKPSFNPLKSSFDPLRLDSLKDMVYPLTFDNFPKSILHSFESEIPREIYTMDPLSIIELRNQVSKKIDELSRKLTLGNSYKENKTKVACTETKSTNHSNRNRGTESINTNIATKTSNYLTLNLSRELHDHTFDLYTDTPVEESLSHGVLEGIERNYSPTAITRTLSRGIELSETNIKSEGGKSYNNETQSPNTSSLVTKTRFSKAIESMKSTRVVDVRNSSRKSKVSEIAERTFYQTIDLTEEEPLNDNSDDAEYQHVLDKLFVNNYILPQLSKTEPNERYRVRQLIFNLVNTYVNTLNPPKSGVP